MTVIIAARNSAQFLTDAIRSVQAQTVRTQILYVDDGSTDESPAVAQRLGIPIIRQKHSGVVAARNAGLAATQTEYVLFLDGDDQLPPQFIERKLAAIQPGTFVYGPFQSFGADCYCMEAPDWSPKLLWCSNYVHTSALFRTDDLRSVGGWRNTLEQHCWDWDLAWRLHRAGKRGIPERSVPLLYRRHDRSLTSDGNRKNTLDRNGYLMRCGMGRVAVVCLYSGRLPGLLRPWLQAVSESVNRWRASVLALRPSREFALETVPKPRLIFMATDSTRGVWETLQEFADSFSDISLIHNSWGPWADERNRNEATGRRLTDSYNQLFAIADAEIIWSVEDDILVPSNAMESLARRLLWPARYAVSGIYHFRNMPNRIMAVDWNGPPETTATFRYRTGEPKTDVWVDLAGTGCLMVSRVLAEQAFSPDLYGYLAHDWAWCWKLRGFNLPGVSSRILLAADVKCRHYQTEERWV